MTIQHTVTESNPTVDVVTPIKRPAGRPKGVKSTTSSQAISDRFLDLCRQGHSLTQISAAMNIPKEQFERWSKDKVKHKSFVKAFQDGKTAWQAYHETLLQKMIRGEIKAASAEISAQQFVLKTQFKSEWTEKTDSKIEITAINRMSDDQLEAQILNLLSKTQVQAYLLEEAANSQVSVELPT